MQEHTRWFSFSTPTWFAEAPSMTISLVNGVNPLQTTLLELGIVSGRVALLLRSAEIQPLFGRFVSNTIRYSPPPPLLDICYRRVVMDMRVPQGG